MTGCKISSDKIMPIKILFDFPEIILLLSFINKLNRGEKINPADSLFW